MRAVRRVPVDRPAAPRESGGMTNEPPAHDQTIASQLAAGFARSPMHGQLALLHAIRDEVEGGRLGDLVAAWPAMDATPRDQAADVLRQWIDSPADSVVVELGETDGRALLGMAARAAGMVGDAATFGDCLLERLKLGPPTPDVAIACGRLRLEAAREPLARIAGSEPRLRHAALLGLIWLDPASAIPEIAREFRDTADLLNVGAASRDLATSLTTFDAAIALCVHLAGREALVAIAEALRGQKPSKDAALAEVLVAAARTPALPAADAMTDGELDAIEARLRAALA
jgi:hypothetical protein